MGVRASARAGEVAGRRARQKRTADDDGNTNADANPIGIPCLGCMLCCWDRVGRSQGSRRGGAVTMGRGGGSGEVLCGGRPVLFIYVTVMVVIEVSVFGMGVRRVLGEAGWLEVGRYMRTLSANEGVSSK